MARSRARRLAHEQRPGHVRAVAADLRPEVEQQHLARPRPRGRRASRAAAPPADPHRHATSKASASAPCVRISHSRASASSRSVTPGRIVGSSRSSAASATAHAAPTRSSSAGSLTCAQLLEPAVGRHQLHVRRGRRQTRPRGVADEARLDRDASTRARRSPPIGPQARRAAPASDPAGRCRRPRCAIRGTARAPGPGSASRPGRPSRPPRPGTGRRRRRPVSSPSASSKPVR